MEHQYEVARLGVTPCCSMRYLINDSVMEKFNTSCGHAGCLYEDATAKRKMTLATNASKRRLRHRTSDVHAPTKRAKRTRSAIGGVAHMGSPAHNTNNIPSHDRATSGRRQGPPYAEPTPAEGSPEFRRTVHTKPVHTAFHMKTPTRSRSTGRGFGRTPYQWRRSDLPSFGAVERLAAGAN